MIRAWRFFHHFNSQSESFHWCWMNWLLVLLYLIHSDYFILIYLIDFVDFHWYFEAGRLTVSCQSGGVCCIYTVKLAVCTVWLTLAQPPFKTPKILDFRPIQQHTKSLQCNRYQYRYLRYRGPAWFR